MYVGKRNYFCILTGRTSRGNKKKLATTYFNSEMNFYYYYYRHEYYYNRVGSIRAKLTTRVRWEAAIELGVTRLLYGVLIRIYYPVLAYFVLTSVLKIWIMRTCVTREIGVGISDEKTTNRSEFTIVRNQQNRRVITI